MTGPVDLVLVGIGGYGNSYAAAVLDAPASPAWRVVGCVDPAPAGCKRLAELRRRGVPIYGSVADFFAAARADLAVVSTPLHLHAGQTVDLLGRGCHVLCEKPLCVTPDEVAAMLAAERRTGRVVAVGYQWSFSTAVQELKRDILDGAFGRPLRFKTLVLWPRDRAYYQRSRWAGRVRDPSGAWVLDSPVNNACAHYLHNMFYLLGPALDRSATPATVSAELYRANPIENYDTAAVRVATAAGFELLFVTSHAVADRDGPHFRIEFERAVVDFRDGPATPITARFADGRSKEYGSPNADKMRKLWSTMDDVRHHRPTVCGIVAAAAQTECAWAIQQAPGGIVDFPADSIQTVPGENGPGLAVAGLGATLRDCYEQWKLPGEVGLAWARPSTPVAVGTEVAA